VPTDHLTDEVTDFNCEVGPIAVGYENMLHPDVSDNMAIRW
jgi:hypothetical protein